MIGKKQKFCLTSRLAFSECLVALRKVKEKAKEDLDKGMQEIEQERLQEQNNFAEEIEVIT
jgi:hypothetical protein